jgi:signal transduction histidine kinase
VDLPALAADVVAECHRDALAADVELELHAEPLTLCGYPAALAVMLRNLVDNAIRHSPPGGTVAVTIRALGGGELCVSDEGGGIPPDQRDRVFERFYRRLGSGGDGCGLGLSIVARAVQLHGASIHLDDARDPSVHPSAPGLRVVVRFADAATGCRDGLSGI